MPIMNIETKMKKNNSEGKHKQKKAVHSTHNLDPTAML